MPVFLEPFDGSSEILVEKLDKFLRTGENLCMNGKYRHITVEI